MEIENLAAPTLKPLGAPGEGDISQRDPAWLKERGDRYYLLRDFASAEGAYTMVLAQFANKIIAHDASRPRSPRGLAQAVDCVVACYSNRAACKLQRPNPDALAAAKDCTHALAIMSRARCVNDVVKTEAELRRCQLRLLARRAAAYVQAGVLSRAHEDLSVASHLLASTANAETSADPSAIADRQMLAADMQRVAEAQATVDEQRKEADALLSDAQHGAAAGDDASKAPLRRARELYDLALEIAPADAACLANRGACHLHLGDAGACVADCKAGLEAVDAEEKRGSGRGVRSRRGQFALPAPPDAAAARTERKHGRRRRRRHRRCASRCFGGARRRHCAL